MKILPKISIVTPTFNQGAFIEQTIESVLTQDYPNLEYIIIDGGSSDNTIEIIKRYENRLKYWVSEKDRGQAHAINKGLAHCTGEIFNWLNSDDYLADGVLFEIAELFQNENADLVAGNIEYFGDDSENVIGENKNLSADGLMSWKKAVRFNQPGVWMRRNLLKASGGIREDYHYCFDRELLVRYLYRFPKVVYTPSVFVNFRLHPESKTVSFHDRFAKEGDRLIDDVFNNPELLRLYGEAKLKIQCKAWSAFLLATRSSNSSPLKKVLNIIRNIHRHPRSFKYARMTAGAFKKFIVGEERDFDK